MHVLHRFVAPVFFLAVFLVPSPAPGQPAPAAAPQIQDNSFFIEEAYNQEAGVVQTIQTFTRAAGSGEWAYTLTQEWPVPDVRNQFSFTVPVQGLSSPAGLTRGVGDIALNYRYQLVGSGKTRVAVSPRLTLLVPTGDETRGLGSGGFGLQIGLPLSLALSERLVTHTNLGATHVFNAKDPGGNRASLTSASAGQSLVWLAHPALNVLVEAVVARNQVLGDDGAPVRRTDAVISPGFRAALNLPGDLQIVTGLAVPIGVGPSRGQRSLFLYLSAELPFWSARR
ncbi:MAG: transporter [Acidobacteriota bacterium]